MSGGGGQGNFGSSNFGNSNGYFPSYGSSSFGGSPMQKGMSQPVDYSSMGGSMGNVAMTQGPTSGGAAMQAALSSGTGTPAYNPQPYTANIHEPIIDRSNTPYGPDGQRYGYFQQPSPFGPPPGGDPSMPQTGGNMTVQAPPPPSMFPQQTGGNMNVQQNMPSWLSQLMQSMPQQQQQPQAPMAPPAPLQSSDPNVQAYLNQNYMPGIHGGPDPSMLAGSMNPAPQPKSLIMSENQPNALARPLTGPTGTVNGPGGLGFTPPGQPTQLFGPTAALFGGATMPPGTPNNFGYFPGTQQWGAPNMGWASQWGKQPG